MEQVSIEVKNALNNGKLNEGMFTDYLHEFAPEFNVEAFKSKFVTVLTVMQQLVKMKEVTAFDFCAYYPQMNKSKKLWSIDDTFVNANAEEIANKVIEMSKTTLGEQFDELMKYTFTKIYVNPNRNLVKHINKQLNPAIQNQLKDLPGVKFHDDPTPVVKYSTQTFMENGDSIINFFS